MWAGDHDMERAVNELAQVLPEPLRALARIAYDYRWSWSKDGAAMFEAIDPPRWARTGHNPRRLLTETHPTLLASAAANSGFVGWVSRIAAELAADRARPVAQGALTATGIDASAAGSRVR